MGATLKTVKGSVRRQQIVTAAIKVFADRGYEGASLREIGERAGISKGNLSYYFAIKDDLLYEIVTELHDSFLELADSWASVDDSPRARMRYAARSHVRLVCRATEATRISYEDFRYLSSERRSEIIGKRDRYEAVLRTLIAQSEPSPTAAANINLATKTVLGTLNWPYQWYSPGGGISAEDLADLVSDMALRSLGL